MTLLRYGLAALFAASMVAGLVSLARSEAAEAARGDRAHAGGGRVLSRPRTWFTCAAILFGAVVALTILFPPR